jgi:hypothetical protein
MIISLLLIAFVVAVALDEDSAAVGLLAAAVLVYAGGF